ncbi:MAG TPA: ABC transporter permease [Flavitalea sp.]|nr:ABC transporter permease [Flavitalea sp.]
MPMLRNYFKIAWRNIERHKVFAFINILGLSLGICACIVIYIITDHEFSFDRFHPDQDRIYRVVGGLKRVSGEKEFLNSPFAEVAMIEDQVTGFESKAAIHFMDGPVSIQYSENKQFADARIILTQPEYFDIFKYEWLAGNPALSLKEPYRVVLTATRARLYFGDLPFEKMVGKIVTYQDSLHVSVTGIIKDWEKNSDFSYTDFISLSTAPNSFLRDQIPTADWRSLHPHRSMAFVKLSQQATAAEVNQQLENIRRKIKPSDFETLETLHLQALGDIHFSNDYFRPDDGDGFRKAHLPTLYMLMGLALFILIIATINFINLSTAQSIHRSKEVGVRKVMGGNRISLVFQFLTETFVLTFFAVCMSVLLVKPVLTLFSSYIPREVKFSLFGLHTFLFLVVITLVTSLLAGFYPAKVLSSYTPALSLKGAQTQKGTSGVLLRKGLIVFQFSMSLIFIIGTLVISNQIDYMRSKDKGFSTDAILTINSWTDKSDKLKLLKEKISGLSGVEKAILQGTAPMGFGEMGAILKYKAEDELAIEVNRKMGDHEFIPFYKMKIVAGRNLAPADSLEEFVINEAYSRALGFTKPQDAIGKFLFAGEKSFPIVGVVADFHHGSLRNAIMPAVIENSPEWKRNIAVKLSSRGKGSSEVKATILQIENLWKQIFPEDGFDYSFLDESISWLFEKEKQAAWLMTVSMIITIFISCMGLFGLAMFMAQTRTKEIGIRKVLGASVANITGMLSRDFAKLVMLSIVIASPIAWYLMHEWLQDFAYRTRISFWVFFIAGMAALLIALITVSFQAIKAAIANPVQSLRTE